MILKIDYAGYKRPKRDKKDQSGTNTINDYQLLTSINIFHIQKRISHPENKLRCKKNKYPQSVMIPLKGFIEPSSDN